MVSYRIRARSCDWRLFVALLFMAILPSHIETALRSLNFAGLCRLNFVFHATFGIDSVHPFLPIVSVSTLLFKAAQTVSALCRLTPSAGHRSESSRSREETEMARKPAYKPVKFNPEKRFGIVLSYLL